MSNKVLVSADYTIYPSLTSMDFLMSLEEIFLNEAHVTLAALKWLFTCSMNNIQEP